MYKTEDMDVFTFLEALYRTLRNKRPNYNSSNYYWRLGADLFEELGRSFIQELSPEEKVTLFGIDVEIDFSNPSTIQLFEDITNEL